MRITLRKILLTGVLCIFGAQAVFADTELRKKTFSFGVVPQQAAAKLANKWVPLIRYLEKTTGYKVIFSTAKDIPTFEQRVIDGEYDFVYMNPYHYTEFHKMVGYDAIVKARDKKLKGILVVRKNGKIKSLDDIRGLTVAFPSPAAFAASILVQAELKKRKISYMPKYVSSHDSVYRAVASGLIPAGGGVMRTYNSIDINIRNQLQILWTSPGNTPHAIASHPRIEKKVVDSITNALIKLEHSSDGKLILDGLKIKGFINANDSDWDDIRALNIDYSVGLDI